MKVVAAFLLAALSGKASPTSGDVKTILSSVGAEAEDAQIELLLKEVNGKDLTELIAAGREKLASVPSGGGGGMAVSAAPSAGGGGGAAPAAESKKEEKKEEKEESDDDMGFSETPVKQMKNKMTISSKLKPSPDSRSRSSGNVDALKKKVLTKSYSALTTSKSKAKSQQVASPVLKPRMGEKDNDAKIKKATVLSRVASKKVPVSPRSSLSPRLSLRLAGNLSLRKSQSLKAASSSSSRPNQKLRHVNRADESKQSVDYPVEEKTLHVVEVETTNKAVLEHDQNQQCFNEPSPPLPQTQSTERDDECTVSEAEDYEYPSESNEAESTEEEIEMSNGEKKPRARNNRDSSDDATKELRFRRGKVVDADSVGESARKLKFRKGRGLGEDNAQDVQVRRSFKKREDIREEEEDDDGEKVVLRHQDVQEKDAQGLFNNVIEETASKLVEARKSKVKALVGAFETVISLQESKPPANPEIGHLD